MVLSEQSRRAGWTLINWRNEQVSQPVPVFQFVARGHSSRGDDVRPVPAVAAQCGGPSVRAGGDDICHETVRFWWNHFDPMLASEIRRQRVSRMKGFCHWRCHLNEVFVKINGERHYLWRAVDHVGEVLESYVTEKRDKAAALAFLKKALKRHGRAQVIVTDGLRSYPAAMRQLGNLDRREMGRWKNNRAENSHLPFRRRERATLRLRRIKSLQKFVSVHASLHNHFNSERHLVDRQTYKTRRSAALAEWQLLSA